MTIPAAADGHGSTFTFGAFAANIISIAAPTMKRNAIDTTHLGSVDVMESIPAKLVDAGEVSIDCEFDPASLPPIQDAEGALAITFDSTVPATWTWARAFCTSVKLPNVKSGEKLTASLTFKLSSIPAIT